MKESEPTNRLGVQVVGAMVVSLCLVLVILYIVGSWFSGDWNPFNGTGEKVDWPEVARVAVPAAGLVAATVAAVLGYHGQVTKFRELENDRDVALTRRFTEAVGQLADGSLPVRLGGLYALERIAIDSARDRFVVSDVLGAFVRDAATKDVGQDCVTALLIASRSRRSGWGEGLEFNYTGARLDGLALPAGEILRNCIFVGASLRSIKVRGVDFTDSDLRDADLRDADFSNCDMTGCSFSASTLVEGANFAGAQVRDVEGFPGNLEQWR